MIKGPEGGPAPEQGTEEEKTPEQIKEELINEAKQSGEAFMKGGHFPESRITNTVDNTVEVLQMELDKLDMADPASFAEEARKLKAYVMAGFEKAIGHSGFTPLTHRFEAGEGPKDKEAFLKGAFGACLYEHRPGVAIPALAKIAEERGIDWHNDKKAMQGIIEEYLPIIEQARNKAAQMENQDAINDELGLSPKQYVDFLDQTMEQVGKYQRGYDEADQKEKYLAK